MSLGGAAGSLNLDQEYLPTLNTKRFQEFPNPFEQVMLHFMLVCKAETDRVREVYNVRENVRYGGVDDNQLLDIYYKGEERDTPLFVYLHGGYWKILDKSTSGSFVAPLVERGYRVILADYNLCPNVTLQQLTQETTKLFDWVYQYAKETNTSHISFSGHSAGAHLLSLLLKTPTFPQMPLAKHTTSLFLICGVYDLRQLWQLESVNTNNIFSLDAQKALELSPLFWKLDSNLIEFYKEQKIKIHVLVAENDSSTFKNQSRALAEKLISNGLQESEVKFKIFDDYDHFDIIEDVPKNGSAINNYIVNNL